MFLRAVVRARFQNILSVSQKVNFLGYFNMNVVISKGPLRNKDLRNKIF